MIQKHGRPRSGSERLKTALRRAAPILLPDLGPDLDQPEPSDDWQRATDRRLEKLETALNSQNRLLLLTIVAIVGDFAYRVTQP